MRALLYNITTIVNVLRNGSQQNKFEEDNVLEIMTSASGSSLAIMTNEYVHHSNIPILIVYKVKGILRNSVNKNYCSEIRMLDIDSSIAEVDVSYQLKGVSQSELADKGGGIARTIKNTSAATEDHLYELLVNRIKQMVRKGTTTIECKTGYGLWWESELKLLRVLNRARSSLPVDIVITYLPAQSVPRECTTAEFVDDIVQFQLPHLDRLMRKGDLHVDNIDVCCERGLFNISQTEAILTAGHKIGLNANFHADEFCSVGGAELAGRIRARAVSHVEEASPSGVALMANNGTAAILLPVSSHLLALRPAPARAIIEAGVPVALGTDFSPTIYCLSMPFVMFLACTSLGMTADEALVGATINSAYSLNLSDRIGALTVGRQADLVVLACERWENIIYQTSEAESLITHVVKRGRLIYSQAEGFVGFPS